MAVTKLDIINKALLAIGLPTAASINDVDWNGSEQFEQCALEVLRTFPWGFATAYATLAPSGITTVGWAFTYNLPTDYVRVIDIRNSSDLRQPASRFCILRNKHVCTNISPCNMRYVANVQDPDDWPPDFRAAVATLLAATIAPLAAQTQAMTPSLIQLYHVKLEQAQYSDSQETMERVPLPEDIYMARAGNGVRQQQ